MARTATVSTLDLGTAAGVMGVIDTLTSAAASGRKVRVVPAADEARNREAARAAINGGRTAARKETPVVASDKTVESKVKRAVRQDKPGSIEAMVEAIKDPAEKESALAMVQRAQAKRRANGTKVVKAQQVPVDATVADTLAGPEDKTTGGTAEAREAQAAHLAAVTGETRHCAGGPKWGIPPHEAPVATWGPPTSRTCRPCAAEYVKRVKAAKAGKALTGEELAHVVGDDKAIAAFDTAAQVDPEAVDGTAAQAEEHAALAAALEAAGGESTDDGQTVLRAAAMTAAEARKAADRDRKRVQRAALKAANAAKAAGK